MCSRAITINDLISCVLIVAAVRRVVASSSLTQSLKGITTAGMIIIHLCMSMYIICILNESAQRLGDTRFNPYFGWYIAYKQQHQLGFNPVYRYARECLHVFGCMRISELTVAG